MRGVHLQPHLHCLPGLPPARHLAGGRLHRQLPAAEGPQDPGQHPAHIRCRCTCTVKSVNLGRMREDPSGQRTLSCNVWWKLVAKWLNAFAPVNDDPAVQKQTAAVGRTPKKANPLPCLVSGIIDGSYLTRIGRYVPQRFCGALRRATWPSWVWATWCQQACCPSTCCLATSSKSARSTSCPPSSPSQASPPVSHPLAGSSLTKNHNKLIKSCPPTLFALPERLTIAWSASLEGCYVQSAQMSRHAVIIFNVLEDCVMPKGAVPFL